MGRGWREKRGGGGGKMGVFVFGRLGANEAMIPILPGFDKQSFGLACDIS